MAVVVPRASSNPPTPVPQSGLSSMTERGDPRSYLLDVWVSALEQYKQDAKRDLLAGRFEAEFLEALLHIVDRQQNKFKEYRARGTRIRDVLEPVLRLIGLLSESVDGSLASSLPPAQAFSVAIRVIFKAAKNVGAHYDTIVKMLEELSGFADPLSVLNRQEIDAPSRKIAVEILAQLLATLGVTTKLIKQRRPVRYIKTLLGTKTDTSAAMEKLSRLLNQAVSSVTSSAQGLQISEAPRDDCFRNKVRSRLSPPDPSTNHNAACQMRHGDTGDWFIRGEEFQRWTETPGAFLWVHGIPGNGKTILCSTIIQTLQRAYQQANNGTSVAVAYFYFDFSDHGKLSFQSLVHSLVTQLLFQGPGTPASLENLCTKDLSGQQPKVDGLIAILKALSGYFDKTYIALDALDECTGSERARVLRFLGEMKSWNLPALHVLATSRPEQEIDVVMQNLPASRFDLHGETSGVDHDIRQYLESLLRDDFYLRDWGAPEKAMIVQTLVQRAGGMFQWVRCQLDPLRKCVTHSDLQAALTNLPETLDATYDRMLQNIPDSHREKVHHMLQFLCCSARPLLLGELAEVVTVSMGSQGMTHYVPGNRLRGPSDALTMFDGLLSLSTRPDLDNGMPFYLWHPNSSDEIAAWRVVQLSHSSVKDYLVSERIRSGSARSYRIDTALAHGWIAMTCLAYLDRFDDPDGLDGQRMEEDLDVALASYAAKHWIWHLQCQGRNDDYLPLQMSIRSLLHPLRRPQFLNWVRMSGVTCLGVYQHIPLGWQRDTRTIPDPLYYACDAGLLGASGWLLSQGAEVNTQGREHQNALMAASAHGHEAMVRLLIDNGANVNKTGGFYGSALQAASRGGHKAVVQLLVDNGADVNKIGGHYGNALQAACCGGYEAAPGKDLGADSLMDGDCGNVLQSEDFEAVVRLLVDKGADVNGVGGYYGTALQAASQSGREALVRLLVDEGADINKSGGYYGNALLAACSRGHEAIVRLLLDLGAEVNAQEKYHGNALHAACAGGHEAIVILLLERGAKVNMFGGWRGYALRAACWEGHTTIVRLLIDRGAEVNVQGGAHWNALYTACLMGQKEVVKLLLDRGAEVNEQPNVEPHVNALQMACMRGDEAIIRMLLDRGADVSAAGECHGNALQMASTGGREAIMRLLLDRGVEVNAQGSHGNSL